MTRLHVFDMDGTLLSGAASVELSRYFGTFEAAYVIEQGWLRGEISDVGFWEQMLPMWAEADEAEIDRAFEAASWIDGVREVFADIAARGERSMVISQSPHFFVRRLERWGVDTTYGSRVEPGGPSSEEQLLTAQDKVDITRDALTVQELGPAQCVAYGDSGSDALLFEWLPYTVAVNGTPAIREVAAAVYDGPDLRSAYATGRSLLEGVGAES